MFTFTGMPTNSARRIRFAFGKIPVGKIASTNLSCAKRFVLDVASRYFFGRETEASRRE